LWAVFAELIVILQKQPQFLSSTNPFSNISEFKDISAFFNENF
jgi:hypothetical protein